MVYSLCSESLGKKFLPSILSNTYLKKLSENLNETIDVYDNFITVRKILKSGNGGEGKGKGGDGDGGKGEGGDGDGGDSGGVEKGEDLN